MPSDDYLDPYREAVKLHGPSFDALLWRNAEYQVLRFRVLDQLLDPRGRVVADMGCGRGDWCDHMHRGGIEYGRYVGVEGIPELAAESNRRLAGLPEARCVERDFTKDGVARELVREHGVEAIAFCGSLNTFDQPLAEHTLDLAWRAVAGVRGGRLAFNFLSDRTRETTDDTGPANRFDTRGLVSWALDRTPRVVLRHEYLSGHDATIAMYA